jgi:phosphodiesterase/alkaline phosphatase D-like protein
LCLGNIISSSCEFEEIDYSEPIPTVLPASEITSSSFLVSWMPIEGGEKYTILVSDNQNFDENSFLKGFPTTITGTSYQVTGLEADTEYFYQVKINSTKAEYSAAISVTTLPLLAPQIHYPKQITPLSFVAQWLSVEGAEGYQLYVSEDANFTSYIDGYDGKMIDDTTALVSGLTADKNYFYRVKTVRGASVSVVSELMEVSTSSLAKPILAEPSDISFTSVTINWNAVGGATSYRVYVATDPLVITDVLPDYNGRIVGGSAFLVITGINANTTYYYRVQALNEQSASEVSEVGTTRTTNLMIPTARPATSVRIDGFQANWNSVANAASYVLDVSRNESFTSYVTGYQAKEVVDTAEVISGLLRNTNYYYRVRSKGFGAVSANSNVIQATTSSFASPRALEAIELQPTSFRAVWKPVTGADSYRLEVATDANFENNLAAYNNISVTDTMQQVIDLIVNRRYFYRVRALKGGILSGYSNIIDLTTTNLSIPQNLTVTNQQLTQFRINWSAVTGATRYRVDVGFDPLVEIKIGIDYDNRIVNGSPNPFLDVTGLEPNRTYYFKVRAENALSTGGSATGSGKTAPIDPPVALSPDPAKTTITSFEARWQAAANAESYLVDVALNASFSDLVVGYNGQEVQNTATSLVVTGLEPGRPYYYRVRSKRFGATSDYSSTISVTTTALTAPAAQDASNQEVYQFTANWQEVTGADRYLLYVATDLAFTNVLSAYNGKPVLGSAHEVTGLDPYTTYYYRLQSKQSAAISGFSNTVTVDAVIGGDCVITERDFGSLGRESYAYTSGQLSAIELYDGSNNLVVNHQITYDNNLIEKIITDSADVLKEDRVWSYVYETYNVSENRIKEINVSETESGPVIGKIHFSYTAIDNNQVSMIRYRSLPANAITRRESYAYLGNQTEVSDSSAATGGVTRLVKRLTLEDKFHTDTMLPSDIALLLFNPIEPGEGLLPFIPQQRPTYYEYDITPGPSKIYAYPYANLSKGIPKRILANGGVPRIEYLFSVSGSCNF